MNDVTTLRSRDKIMQLEKRMIEDPESFGAKPISLDVRHHFAPGIYARELYIPAGTLLTGKIHKTEHLNILVMGRIEISNLGESKEMVAPLTFVSPPGTKRAGYAHEDCIWITIHATDETDLDKLEKDIVTTSFDQIEALA